MLTNGFKKIIPTLGKVQLLIFIENFFKRMIVLIREIN